MNSPDPGSPISTDTSGSPPPDDFQFSNRDQQHILSAADTRLLANASTSFTPTQGSSKRRLPGGSSSDGPQRRDPKSRRREDVFGFASGSQRVVIEGQTGHALGKGLGSNTLQSRGDYTSRRDKEDLIDLSLVEQLRQGRIDDIRVYVLFLNFRALSGQTLEIRSSTLVSNSSVDWSLHEPILEASIGIISFVFGVQHLRLCDRKLKISNVWWHWPWLAHDPIDCHRDDGSAHGISAKMSLLDSGSNAWNKKVYESECIGAPLHRQFSRMLSSGVQNVVGMALVLGATSYGVGLAPLSVPLSKKQLSMLSSLSAGLLIGTALGVILPEGIEQLVADADWNQSPFSIGMPVLLGFALMFLLEEYATSHGQPAAHSEGPTFDVDLEERGRPSSFGSRHVQEASGTRRAYPLSLGLIIHALVDGYALGVSASTPPSLDLSLIVFLAIIIHKVPTAFSLTTALLANSLSITESRKHLLYFSLATPASSLLSYSLYASHSENHSLWTGSALLFSGGTFVYVASVVQPIPSQASASDVKRTVRTLLLVGGMFFPVLASRWVGH